MSFKSTGRKVTREHLFSSDRHCVTVHDETLQYCDQCGAQISLDTYSSEDHWELRLERRVSWPDDAETSLDFCSLACVASWCAEASRLRERLGAGA